MRDLIILGSRIDPHIAKVEAEMHALRFERVKVLDFATSSFAFESPDGGPLSLTIDGSRMSDAPVIWDRANLDPGTALYPEGDDAEARDFAAHEWRSLYRMVLGSGQPLVVNSVRSRQHLDKPHQQTIAAGVGFAVPRTLITNDRAALRRFAKAGQGAIIMKSLSGVKVRSAASDEEHFNVMTMRVSPEAIEAASDAELRYCPHLVQNEIVKDFELRVVWVAGTAIAFRIGSQQFAWSETDWRNGTRAIAFEPYSLPADVGERIDRFMETMGLWSGSLDLIVDRDGQAWFLECNQQGAWGWLNHRCGGEIGRLFARELHKLAIG